HITGELVGRFLKERKAIHAISLVSNTAALTAWANDYNYETVFSRQVEAHGKKGGVLWAISTSGNSNNVIHAIQKAKELGLSIIGMTGESGGKMASLCDVLLNVPSKETPRIQEMHIILYHYICEELERRYLENGN
ncbi:MAG: SIS domain-containing protein, partial [Leptospiraceae bacterium]|nr:SIS domain-containing protein [Leptospiraceae bacterium]